MQRRQLIQAAGALPLATLAARTAFAFDGPELYAGEKALYAEAQKEGLCVSFDTGPEWANWKSLFRDFKKRYPEIELTYNDIGSAATVVALEKTKRRPQADTAYYFAASAVDAAKKDVVAPFKPVNFDKLPPVFREAEGRWFTIHTLNIAFLVNKKLVKNVPTGWADLLKPEFKNTVVYLDPRSTGIGQVLTFAAAYANGGSVDNVQPGTDYLGKLHAAGILAATSADSGVPGTAGRTKPWANSDCPASLMMKLSQSLPALGLGPFFTRLIAYGAATLASLGITTSTASPMPSTCLALRPSFS